MMPWGSFFNPRDGRGRESRTLFLVAVAFTLLSLRFVAGGMLLDFGWFRWELAASSFIDYGAAIAAVLSVWLGREFIRDRATKTARDQTLAERKSDV